MSLEREFQLQQDVRELRQQLAISEGRLHDVAELCATVEQERDELRQQLAEAQAAVKVLRDAVSYSKHQCEGMRVWGGMSWTYHPFQAKRIFDACEKAMADTEPKP